MTWIKALCSINKRHVESLIYVETFQKIYLSKKIHLLTIVHISEVNKLLSKYELPQQTLVCIIFNKDNPFSNLKKNIDIPILLLS